MRDLPIAGESRRLVLVTEILAPCLPFFWRSTKALADPGQSIAETMGLGVRETCRLEGVSKNLADWRRPAPWLFRKTLRRETPIWIVPHKGRREQRIVRAKPKFLRQ